MSRWENIGDKYLLNALGDDPLAAQQSVAMYLDPVAKCIEWHTNGHVIRMRPDLPSAIVSGPFATSFGYEWNLAGGLVFGVGDVSLTKRAGILDSFGLQGVQIYYIVPVGQIPDIPIIKIEKIDILDGMIDQLNLVPQGVLSAQDIAAGASRNFAWGDNSMPIYWKNKRHNNSADNRMNYMNGKIWQEAPPLAHPLVCADLQAGNVGNRSFAAAGGSETIGEYEVLAGGFQKTFKRQDLIDGLGVGTHYAFAATLGYTTEGVNSLGGAGSEQILMSVGTMPEDGTVTSHWIFNAFARSTNFFTAAYNDTGTFPTYPNALYANSQTTQHSVAVQWEQFIPVTTTHDLVSGNDVWLWQHTYLDSSDAIRGKYDGGGAQKMAALNGQGSISTAPDPMVGGYSFVSPVQPSAYIEYTPSGGGGIIPQIMHHRQLQRRR